MTGSRRGPFAGVIAALCLAAAAACGDGGTSYEWETVEGVTYADTLDIDLATFSKTTDYPPPVWYKDLVVGTGDSALVGDTLFTHYTGWLRDGTQFDSNVGEAPYKFYFWVSNVIGGWHLGMRGQLEGGTRKLVIPPDWAYGDRSAGPIYPGAVLIFEVTLDSIHHKP